ncbi:MAG: hypothetical protein LPK03_07335 [Pontibacter sp.]|nr:hypothetical protein [Pontibacter sp.]
MKNLLPLFALLLLTLTACDTDKEPEAVLIPEATLHRSFISDRNGPAEPEGMATYLKEDVTPNASITFDGLKITLQVPYPVGRDAISFLIARNQLLPDYIGVYNVQPFNSVYMKEATFRYAYIREQSPSSTVIAIIDSDRVDVNQFNYFTITEYSPRTQTISGDFELRMLDATDPRLDQSTLPQPQRCDIILRGSFKNVKLNR